MLERGQVAVQLYTNSEKETLTQLVDTMVRFGITYKHGMGDPLNADGKDSSWQGQGEMRLDPPISSMVTFEVRFRCQG